jgi:phenylacetate-coenzyme A ligase PaaK-like adenylate-forming protein
MARCMGCMERPEEDASRKRKHGEDAVEMPEETGKDGLRAFTPGNGAEYERDGGLFPVADALCSLEDAFAFSPERDSLFTEALFENYRYQYERHPFLRFLAVRGGFSPERAKASGDIYDIPPLFVGTLKLHRFCSVPDEEVVLTLTSSGTSGQKTQLLLDTPSLARLEALSRSVFRGLGFESTEPVHYLLFGYEREHAGAVGTSWSTEQKMACAPAKTVSWLIRWDDASQEFEFDAVAAARRIAELAEDAPLRFLGFPAFMYRAVEELRKIAPGLRVDPRSFVIAGGGWKNHAGVPLSQEVFARFLEESLGLPRENVRDVFGMAEHGVPYGACRYGHHHVPIFGRLSVRDPRTLEVLPHGVEGLLHLLTPYNTAQPNCSLLATDVARLEEDCPCGLPGTYIASVRRGGTSKHKGCAIAAQEILDRMARTGA